MQVQFEAGVKVMSPVYAPNCGVATVWTFMGLGWTYVGSGEVELELDLEAISCG